MKLPTIRQLPSGNWFCQLRLNGKSISITEPTEAKCRARAMAYKTGVLQARRDPASLSLGAAMDAYIDVRRGICSPTTIEGYEKIRKQYFQGLMSVRLSAITERSLSQAVSQERQRTSRRGAPLSAKTIHSALGFVRSVLRENGITLGRVVAPEVKRRVLRLPPPEQVIPAVVGTDVELPCLLAAWLSLSMSEIRGLTKSSSLYNHQLFVVDTVVSVHGRDIRKEGGKEEQRTRAFDLPPYLERLIDQVPGDVICPLSVRQIEKRFSNALEAAGLPHMTFHQLRHLNASTMAMLGIQKEVAMERGGWKTPHTMNTVYTHTFDAPRQAADQKIDAYFEKLIANESLTKSKKRRVYKLVKMR